MAEIIELVSEWAALAHRVSATQDQIGGQRFKYWNYWKAQLANGFSHRG
jgi:hypothetical protein